MIKRKKIKHKLKFKRISLTKVFLIVTLFLLITQIILSNSLATSGGELEALNTSIKTLELENKKIMGEVAQSVSLSDTLLKAEEKGFAREPKVITLSGDGIVALKPQ